MKNYQGLPAIILVCLYACNNHKGWDQSQRDKLVKECTEKAVSTMASTGQAPDEATRQKLGNYCSCYQEKLEKQFPSPEAMGKANAGDVANAAKDCLQLMTK
jgi:hypothetical protein